MSNKRINPWDDLEHWTKDALQKAIAEESVAREQAERERDEARPVLEAARRQQKASDLRQKEAFEGCSRTRFDDLSERCGLATISTQERIREFDAARAAAKGKGGGDG